MKHGETRATIMFKTAASLALLAPVLVSGCGDAAPEAAPTADETQAVPPAPRPTTDGAVISVPGSPSPIDPVAQADQAEPRLDPVIFEPFRGRWAVSLADCRTVPGLDRIVIGASEIKFGTANGIPLAVEQEGERAIAVTLRIRDQGRRFERTDRLSIEPDGITLTYLRGDEAHIYKRCPVR